MWPPFLDNDPKTSGCFFDVTISPVICDNAKRLRVLKRLVDVCMRWMAARAEAVNINRVWIKENKVYKCRRWWGWVLITISYPILACRQVSVSVLFTNQWMRWEREVKNFGRLAD